MTKKEMHEIADIVIRKLLEAKEKQEYANALLDDLSIQIAEQIPLVIKEQNAKNYFNNKQQKLFTKTIIL